jgi:cation transport protein ChaC
MQWDAEPGDLWVFGYGSLMWRPGFDYCEHQEARLYGHHRALCVWSWRHRGPYERPGLVFGLDRGGSCKGQAFRVSEADKREVLAYLYERELPTDIYKPHPALVRLADGCRVTALSFVVDRRHPQYAGRLHTTKMLSVVWDAQGHSGPNVEYVLNTLAHMRELGIRDAVLEELERQLLHLMLERKKYWLEQKHISLLY